MDKPIPFLIGKGDAGLKLIELPDELLELLQTTKPILEIKAKESSESTASSAFAVICSEDKTFQIRQQQTSNSIFIVNPKPTAGEDGLQVDAISSIAICGTTLELSRSKEVAAPYLRATLLPYTGSLEMDLDGHSKEFIYSNIPLSTVEIDKDWESLCAFEDTASSYLPTPAALLSTWKAIHETAFVENIDVTEKSHKEKLWQALSGEGIPLGLFEAVFSAAQKPEFPLWVAKLILQVQAGNSMMRQDFSKSLTEVLPKTISQPETFEAFSAFADLSNPVSITLKSSQLEASNIPTSTKRTWHDRLKKK